MDEAVKHQLVLSEQENEVKVLSENLSRSIMRAKDNSNRKLNLFSALFKNGKLELKQQSTRKKKKSDDYEASLIFANVHDLLHSINEVINKVYGHYNTIASDATFETWESNQDLLNVITTHLFDPTNTISRNGKRVTHRNFPTEFEKLIDRFDVECNKFNIYSNRIKTRRTGLELGTADSSGNMSTGHQKIGKSLLTESTVRDIRTELGRIQDQVEAFIEMKKKSQTFESRMEEKGKILGTLSNLTQKGGIRKTVKDSGRILKGKLGLLPKDKMLSRKGFKRLAGAGVGVGGMLAAAFFKSPGLAVASIYFMKKRSEQIAKEKERYVKKINDTHTFKTDIDRAISDLKQNERWKVKDTNPDDSNITTPLTKNPLLVNNRSQLNNKPIITQSILPIGNETPLIEDITVLPNGNTVISKSSNIATPTNINPLQQDRNKIIPNDPHQKKRQRKKDVKKLIKKNQFGEGTSTSESTDAVTAKTKTSAFVGEAGPEQVALRKDEGKLFKGLVSNKTLLGLETGDQLKVDPLTHPSNAITKINTNELTPSQFGKGTNAEVEQKEQDDAKNKINPASFSHPIVDAMKEQTSILHELLNINTQQLDASQDALLKDKGFDKSNVAQHSTTSNIASSVKDKGLFGTIGDILKTAVATWIGNKLLGGAAGSVANTAGAAAGGLASSVAGGVSSLAGGGGAALGTTVAVAAGAALVTAGVFTAGAFLVKKLLDDSGINAKFEKQGKDAQIVKDSETQQKRDALTPDVIAKKDKTLTEYDNKGFFSQIKDALTPSSDYNQARKVENNQLQASKLKTGETRKESDMSADELSFYGSYADGGSFTTNGPGMLQVGESGVEDVMIVPKGEKGIADVNPLTTSSNTNQKPLATNKLQQVIIKDDQSKQTKQQLDLAKQNNKLVNDILPEGSAKADKEEQPSIWDELSKSDNPLLKALGGAGKSVTNIISTGGQAVSSGISAYKGARDSGESFTGSIGKGIGAVSQMFESGKNGAGRISSGAGDLGGKSYGTYQLSTKDNNVGQFLNKSGYGDQFKGLQTGTPEFDAKWKDLAKNDPNFAQSQNDYASKRYAKPQLAKLQKMGVNTDDRAVQEMAMSTGVQYGEDTSLIQKAIAASGKDPSKMTSTEIVSAVQDYKAANVQNNFKSSSPEVQAGVARRIEKEKKVLLSLAGQKSEGANVASKPKTQEQLQADFIAKEGGSTSSDVAKVEDTSIATKAKKKKIGKETPTQVPSITPEVMSVAQAASAPISSIESTETNTPTAQASFGTPQSIPSTGSGDTSNTATTAGSALATSNPTAGTGDGIKNSGADLSKVNPSFESNFEGMSKEFKSLTGKDIQVNSGYRDGAKQAKLYAENLTQYPPNGNGKVAKPGRSPHEKGLAIDINTGDANAADKLGLLSKWGISRPLLNNPRIPEAWHLQPSGVDARSYPTLASTNGVGPTIANASKLGGGSGGSGGSNPEATENTAMSISNPMSSIPNASKLGGSASPVVSDNTAVTASNPVPNINAPTDTTSATSQNTNANVADNVVAQVQAQSGVTPTTDTTPTSNSVAVPNSAIGKANVPKTTTPSKIQQSQSDIAMINTIEKSKTRENQQIQKEINSSIIQTASNTANSGGGSMINNVSNGGSGGGSTHISSGDESMLSFYNMLMGSA